MPAQNTIPSETPRTRTRRRGTQSASAAAGMMDVFAVMAQINDQLGAANDLDTFLKVTVGVIKDLTQFHRVMVYQFDEVWNGVVTAELVDWGVTRDLFRGLHFPAADIPKQVRGLEGRITGDLCSFVCYLFSSYFRRGICTRSVRLGVSWD